MMRGTGDARRGPTCNRRGPVGPGPVLTAVLAVATALGACGDRPRLGPADGHELPPVDTGRVAVGNTAPDFTLEDLQGRPVTLSDLRGRRIVLVFYRGHW